MPLCNNVPTVNKQKVKTMKTITLALTTQSQVNSLMRALEMQCDFQDDTVLEDVVTTADEVRMLSEKDDIEIQTMLHARRKDTSDAIDRLVTTIGLLNQLQNEIDKQHD